MDEHRRDFLKQQAGAPMRNLLTGLGVDEYLTRDDGGGARSFLTDALGSTVALVDGAGMVQAEYTYEPFGATAVSGSPDANALDYTGREDDGTGLKYYRARYYHPGLAPVTGLGVPAGGRGTGPAQASNRPLASARPRRRRGG